MPYNPAHLYVTSEEPEAYELARLLVIAGIPCRVIDDKVRGTAGKLFYTVDVRNRADDDRARQIREPYLASLRDLKPLPFAGGPGTTDTFRAFGESHDSEVSKYDHTHDGVPCTGGCTTHDGTKAIDITPESLKTPEGCAKVAAAQNAWEQSTAEVANLASQFVDMHADAILHAMDMYPETVADFRELKDNMRERARLQDAFLRALAGR